MDKLMLLIIHTPVSFDHLVFLFIYLFINELHLFICKYQSTTLTDNWASISNFQLIDKILCTWMKIPLNFHWFLLHIKLNRKRPSRPSKFNQCQWPQFNPKHKMWVCSSHLVFKIVSNLPCVHLCGFIGYHSGIVPNPFR